MKVICFLFDPNVGGPTIRARQVSTSLKADGVTVRFAMPGIDGTARAFLEEEGFVVDDLSIRKPVLPNKPRAFALFALTVPTSLWRLTWYLRRQRPDVVHINGAFDILPAVAAIFARVPVVWHLNDMLFGARLSRLLGALVGRLSRVVAVTSTPVIAHYNVGRYDPAMLPVPVDVDQFAPMPAMRTPGPIRIALVGNWNPLKRQQDFIAVIGQLKAAGHDVQGHVFGKLLDSQAAYWQPLLDQISEQELSDNIVVHGFTADIPGALKDMDLSVITSQSEAGPMSCLDAMAAGLPVISYDVGDVQRMLDPNGDAPGGIVVPVEDIAGLVAGCQRVIVDPQSCCRMGQAARARAVRLYTIGSVAPYTLAAYRRAIGVTATAPGDGA